MNENLETKSAGEQVTSDEQTGNQSSGGDHSSLKKIVLSCALLALIGAIGLWWYFFYRPAKQFEELDAVKELDESGRVIRIYMTDTLVTTDHLKQLGQQSHLRVLNFAKSELPETGFEHLQKLNNLKLLHLAETNVDDSHLAEIAKIECLEQLPLFGCKGVTDAGMQHVAELKNLIQLSLDGTSVTDKGIVHLKKLGKLKELNLVGINKVTDASVVHLSEIKSLTNLNILNSGISKSGVSQIQKALPKCRITHEPPIPRDLSAPSSSGP